MGKTLSIILVIAIVGALGMMCYVIATPEVGERFTEFYILGPESEAANYPTELSVGEETRVTVGIVNHEYETMSYRVEVKIDGVRNIEAGPVVLEHGEKWEGEVSFVPKVTGENQKLEFLLYRNANAEPYLEALRLWVDVTE